MIPYRRRKAIDDEMSVMAAADIVIGDVILVRRPGAVDRTREQVTHVQWVDPGRIRLEFASGFSIDPVPHTPVGIITPADEPWVQYDSMSTPRREHFWVGGCCAFCGCDDHDAEALEPCPTVREPVTYRTETPDE